MFVEPNMFLSTAYNTNQQPTCYTYFYCLTIVGSLIKLKVILKKFLSLQITKKKCVMCLQINIFLLLQQMMFSLVQSTNNNNW